ncbi:hypothetical protein [Clostridium grantii]|uniref:Calcineurin-like phosphoesterase n=1 Tax=Clostridium grantii DSM 8605 TaxID=1121316 RepID=A0A1M5WXG3_9CLOT|nr:hypothetical protein [Clostridium grantii]SHH92405.1 hypothetical protein SAMN02745207_03207 [Clostridium grantii DSM 8605]
MVLSGHYHCTTKKISEIDDNGDGYPDRKVYQLLFDYQSLEEGGSGYIRLMHFNLKDKKIIFRIYSPSLDSYNSNTESFPLNEEEFQISFKDLGISCN